MATESVPDLRKNLIFDADDTLWQNNVYFIEAAQAFLDIMEEARLDREATRRLLTKTERQSVEKHGYGTLSFVQSLVRTARELLPEISQESIEHVEGSGRAIMARTSVELLPGVEDALRHLSDHNDLYVLTKGEDTEQRGKLERSRLGHYFQHVEVVREKDVEGYKALVARLGLNPETTWMIGNSPRSDINPALAAGLNAVLIPHPQTWEMEMEDLADAGSDRLTVVESLSDLITLFAGDNRGSKAAGGGMALGQPEV